MKGKLLYFIVGGIALLIIFLVWVNWPSKSEDQITDAPAPTPTPTPTPATPTSGLNKSTLLKKGSSGPEVAQLQNMLNNKGAAPLLVVDGKFGTNTRNALMSLLGVESITLASAETRIPTATGVKPVEHVMADSIYNDTTCVVCTRDTSIYSALLKYSDALFIRVYYYWSTVYKPKTGKSLPQMINGESSITNATFASQQKQLAARFTTLNLQ